MKYERIRKPVSAVMLLSFYASSMPAQAMPKYNSTNNEKLGRLQADAIASNPTLKGATIFQDDLAPNNLYVSPSSKKTQSGVYSPVNGAVNCPIFESQFNLTYKLPPSSEWEAVANKGAWTPYFDLQFGNYYRNMNIIIALDKKVAESAFYENKPEFANYKIATEELEKKAQELDENKQKQAKLNDAVDRALSMLGISKPENRETATKVYEAAVKEREDRLPDLITEEVTLGAEAETLRDAYYAAKRAWLPFEVNYEKIMQVKTGIDQSLKLTDSISQTAWARNEQTLRAMETKVVGVAMASYNIWGDEASALQQALAKNPFSKYSVRRLPIFNVSLQPVNLINPVSAGAQQTSTDTGTAASPAVNPMLASRTIRLKAIAPGNPRPLSADAVPTAFYTFTGKNGAPVAYDEEQPKFSSGTFKAEINQGVYCMGSSSRGNPERVSTIVSFGGERRPYYIDTFTYKPRSNRVMAQSVALHYSYHMASDPMGASCTLDYKKAVDYLKNQGQWNFLWWGDSWKEGHNNQKMKSGLNCTETFKPSAVFTNMEENRARMDLLMRKAENEVMAEFLKQFARSWTTEAIEQPDVPREKLKFFSAIGSGMESICGPALFCKITSVVFKGLDEIAGSENHRTEFKENVSGLIVRNYNERSWVKDEADAVIDVVVDAP